MPILVALNLATLGALLWTTTRAGGTMVRGAPIVRDHVRARVIDLVNDRGELRAQLYVQENGGGGIRIYNGRGELRSKFGALDGGGAGLLLMDESTTPTVRLASTADAAELKLSGGARQRIITP